jgi:predicted TIM-barrel fold metal-dependent hydrolase
LIGDDGTEYCFDMGYDRPIIVVTAVKLSRADQEKILRRNAARILRLG